MKFGSFVKKMFFCGGVMMAFFAHAQDFICPTPAQLKDFSGFFLEYPLSLNAQGETNTWLVAEVDAMDMAHGVVNTLLLSPVKTQKDEYPNYAAERMISNLEVYQDKDLAFPICDNELFSGEQKFCACAYWVPADESLAIYVHAEQNKGVPSNPLDNITIAAKAMKKMQQLRR